MRVPTTTTTAKPLFSPGRGRRRDLPQPPPTPSAAAPPSLSASHSRRLRGSGSLKGAHSPMFAAVVAAGAPGGRRRGYAFEAVEPSSPKVTCIGQVRVKSKKKKSKKATLRSRSKRAIGGEVSLRRTAEEGEEGEEYYCKNQGWACQIPASICEALRGAVSELNCFFLPCVGRPKPIGEEEEEAKRRRSSAWSCGAALARWVMAVEASEERGLGGGEVVEMVVEEEEEETGRGGAVGEAKTEVVEKEEKGRVSVCVPPRNALLLMRCRSDPVRIAALESKFWGSPGTKGQVGDDIEDDDDDDEEEEEREQEYDHHNVDGEDTNQEDGSIEAAKGHIGVVLGTRDGELGKPVEGNEPTMEVEGLQSGGKEANEEEAVKIQLQGEAEAEMELKGDEDEEEEEEEEEGGGEDEEVKAEDERKSSLPVQRQRCDSSSREEKRRRRRRRHSISSEREARPRSFSNEEEQRRASFSVDCEARRWWSFSIDQKEDLISELNVSAGLELEKEKECSSEPELAKENLQEQAHEAANEGTEATSKGDEAQEAKIEGKLKGEEEERDKCGGDRLPDCLLLMMYEPKLSMEVSKETWVSSNHFLHRHPHHRPRHPLDDVGANGAEAKTDEECDKCGGGDGEDCDGKEAIEPVNQASPPPPPPPPAARTAQVVEQKLKPAVQTLYQPFVLTRCKSEPIRSAARPAPDACFWNDRYRPIGAAGIGF